MSRLYAEHSEELAGPIKSLLQQCLEQVRDQYRFIFPSAVPLPIQQSRLDIIHIRIRALAWILAIGMPLWSVLDALTFPHDIWLSVLEARLLSGAAFASFLLFEKPGLKKDLRNLWFTYCQLGFIFLIPALFYAFCAHLPVLQTDYLATAVTHSYYLLPFVLMAGVGLFPLTLLESVSVVTLLLTAYYATHWISRLPSDSSDIGMAWNMVLLAAISVVICYSHLRMLAQLIGYSSYDLLTNCLGRRSGEEVVKTLWHYSVRQKSHFAVAFIDLDHFKRVNDIFGHQAGDAVLADAAVAVKQAIRKSDFVIRWGGEEFLVIMPDANIDNATKVLVRMVEKGLCMRPDGTQQTVSVGIAERLTDGVDDEKSLIHVADERLYQAKISGRCRAVSTKTVIFNDSSLTVYAAH